jgi:hypothetical protein
MLIFRQFCRPLRSAARGGRTTLPSYVTPHNYCIGWNGVKLCNIAETYLIFLLCITDPSADLKWTGNKSCIVIPTDAAALDNQTRNSLPQDQFRNSCSLIS